VSPVKAAVRQISVDEVGLWVSYDDRDLAREVPGSRWDPGLKCWRVPRLFVREAQEVADLINGGVSGTTTNAEVDVETSIRCAVQSLMAAVPDDLRAPTWRALAHAFHPDHGGDDRAMRALLAEKVTAAS
jgi:hypothetical protein